MTPLITAVVFTHAPALDRRDGLLGWARITINGVLAIDGVGVRQARDGRLTLSFPARDGRDGRRHCVVRPVDDATRVEIERQVIDQLRAQGKLAS